MKFFITLALSVILSSASYFTAVAEEVTITNQCSGRLWIRSTGANRGPFFLNAKSSVKLAIPRNVNPTPRIEALINCDNSGRGCDADGNYKSLAEFHWDAGGKTWYDVSMVDGYNLPVAIVPYNTGAGPVECTKTACNFNLNNCPEPNKIRGSGNRLVACKNLNRDDGNSAYAKTMIRNCPDAYAWSKDDTRRPSPMRFSCNPGNNGLKVTFC